MARISDVPQPVDPRDPRKVESQKQQDTAQTETTGNEGTKGADSVNISSDARETDALRDRLTEAANNAPDVREDRIADVKARIASGEFDANSDEVKRAIADSLLDQMGI
jgi:negative regulator of flagellin synthesis FlgM